MIVVPKNHKSKVHITGRVDESNRQRTCHATPIVFALEMRCNSLSASPSSGAAGVFSVHHSEDQGEATTIDTTQTPRPPLQQIHIRRRRS